MSITSNIRKLIVVSFWCIVSAGILVLLIAAMRDKKEKICVGYEIDITGSDDHNFIDKKDIESQLSNGGVLSVKGRSIKSFDLKKLEEKLERNSWVSDAELFFDNNQLLKVRQINNNIQKSIKTKRQHPNNSPILDINIQGG